MKTFFIITALILLITIYFLKDTIIYTLKQNALFKAIITSKLTLVLIDTTRVVLLFYILFKFGSNICLMLKF